jgi:hypothetical protein
MWPILALAAVLPVVPAQSGDFTLKNPRASYSVFGQTRKDAKYLGGDLIILNYDLQNLKAADDSTVNYTLAFEITSKSGKSVAKGDPQEFKAELTLGGTSRPALSFFEIPLDPADMAPGEYVFTVIGTDLSSKQTAKVEYPFEVLSPRLGFIQSGIHIPIGVGKSVPTPWSIPAGQTVMLGTAVVGFELGPKSETDPKKRQPNILIEMRIIDEATGKPTLAKPKFNLYTEAMDEINKKVVPFNPLLELNRPGRYKIEMKVTDKHANKTAELVLDVTVYEIK